MKNTKKIIAIALTAIMTIGSLTGCGKNEEKAESAKEIIQKTVTQLKDVKSGEVGISFNNSSNAKADANIAFNIKEGIKSRYIF